jgi:Chaperone of endosialidase
MATPLLGLALPTTGSLTGAWGDTVNNSITSLLDSAVAGTTTLSADSDVTLTTTQEAANQAREAILLWTASGTVTRNITAPAQSKSYIVINSSGTQSIVLRGVGPTTGVTITAGEKALCAWNGSDFVKVSTTASSGVTSVTATSPVASSGGTTPVISLPAATTSASGYLTSTDWNTFNGKQSTISLTTTGTGGAATLVGTTLNIPNYSAGSSGVSTISVASSNGFSGSSSGGSTPILTLQTTVTGLVKGSGGTLLSAVSGTDYAPATSGSSILYGNSSGGFSNVVVGSGLNFSSGTLTATGGSSGVTQVNGTGSVNGITLTGTVTSTGNLTLGGTLSGVSLTSQVSGTLPVANGGTGATASTGSGSVVLATSPTITTPVISGNTSVNSQFLGTRGSGVNNVAFGTSAGGAITTGSSNTAMGISALAAQTTNDGGTAFGYAALSGTSYDNCSGFGAQATVTGANQVQLGNSLTTTYVYGTVQNRSDLRDKADVRDTQLGLNFVNALRPVDYKWDLRDSYKPPMPEDTTDEVAMSAWRESVKIANLTHDGSKKRTRFHHGLIAQEVKAVLDAQGIDFGGFQDHKVAGGDDVLSIGYDELIAPLIKAIQELTARVQQLEAKNG